MRGLPVRVKPAHRGARTVDMPKDDGKIETADDSAAGMTAEEINAALGVVLDESTPSEANAAGRTPDSAQADGQAAESGSPLADPRAQNPPASPATPKTTAADTEAALDQIDSDLAELESLLAQTSSDGTSIPESIAQAPPLPSPTSQPQDASAGNAADKAKSDATVENSGDEASQAGLPDDEASDLQADRTTAPDDLLLDDMTGPAPDPPDGTQTPPPETNATEPQPAAAAAAKIATEPVDDSLAGMFERLLAAIILTPLVAIDMPFAGFSHRVKNVLGLAGIATLLVALATWLVGNHR